MFLLINVRALWERCLGHLNLHSPLFYFCYPITKMHARNFIIAQMLGLASKIRERNSRQFLKTLDPLAKKWQPKNKDGFFFIVVLLFAVFKSKYNSLIVACRGWCQYGKAGDRNSHDHWYTTLSLPQDNGLKLTMHEQYLASSLMKYVHYYWYMLHCWPHFNTKIHLQNSTAKLITEKQTQNQNGFIQPIFFT